MIDTQLYEYMMEMLRKTPTGFHRYLYQDIPWEAQLVGITGARGIGKSTMIRQYILGNQDKGRFLYVSADHMPESLREELRLTTRISLTIDYPIWRMSL